CILFREILMVSSCTSLTSPREGFEPSNTPTERVLAYAIIGSTVHFPPERNAIANYPKVSLIHSSWATCGQPRERSAQPYYWALFASAHDAPVQDHSATLRPLLHRGAA